MTILKIKWITCLNNYREMLLNQKKINKDKQYLINLQINKKKMMMKFLKNYNFFD